MKIIFAGTPDFAVPTLQMLLDNGYPVCAVYTQPDRPAGRGRHAAASPVKQLALQHGLTVMQPASFKEPGALDALRAFDADLMVVVAYGMLLPQAVLDIPRLGCVNNHASLLPRWRGAAPIQRSLLAGDKETGVTLMRIELKLDAGPMLRKAAVAIGADETGGELHDRLAQLGAELLRESLPDLLAERLPGEIQDESLVTYAEKLNKQEARIDWGRPAADIERQVRAFNPWPVAETQYQGQQLRIWRAKALALAAHGQPGTVKVDGRTLLVAAGDGVLRLDEVQLPGGKRMAADAFLNAHNVSGVRLG
ncbi:methionyl-tRNA formyltransferase [Methylogaea oryzae]|uniref:Methionyl-tRNA formyltransferase n=1 Tax=Methylogaea oryzae TaxID=1295382 RepID=A0A8D5AIC5_9GAMM|nr:methionyl-tRNA formyltransferase [Methylogaea oryzae]BBL72388.1 methionyl-tRNA formyltransferase [Methylogaea oryzae]